LEVKRVVIIVELVPIMEEEKGWENRRGKEEVFKEGRRKGEKKVGGRISVEIKGGRPMAKAMTRWTKPEKKVASLTDCPQFLRK